MHESAVEKAPLRQFHVFEQFKNPKMLKFSNGGHLLVIADYKHIHIVSTYGLEELKELQVPSQGVSSLSFNSVDTLLMFTSMDGYY